VPTYIAAVMAGTPEGDFAVLKIVSMIDTKESLPNPLPLMVMNRGDSEKMQIGDPVHLVGYPGVGGNLITVTTGIVSGFDDQNGDGKLESIKTTAEMGGGISGGLAMNDSGDQIGVPTWGVSKGADKIDRMMMINLAVPFIDEGKRVGGAQIGLPGTGTTPSTGTGTGTGTGTTPAKPSAGTGGTGTTPAKPTPPSTGTTPAPATSQGVLLTGLVTDANTGRPIQGAAIAVLRPGLSVEEWRNLPGKEGSDAEGMTDTTGRYRTAPAMARDSRPHTVVVVADGYVPRMFENALKIEPADPDLTQMETIELKKR
jgi:S1-C subfamily serine protease